MALIVFEQTSFSLPSVASTLRRAINASTNLNRAQKDDCLEVLNLLPRQEDVFEPAESTVISGNFSELGTNGYRVFITYNSTRVIEISNLNSYVSLAIDTATPGTSTGPSSTTSVPATGTSVPTVTATAWSQPANPITMARGALSANFSAIYGQSVIIPDVIAEVETGSEPVYLDTHTLGGVTLTTNLTSNYIKFSVSNITGSTIPSYTTATLYRSGVPVASGYSVTGALLSSINLYATVSSAPTIVPFSLVITTTGSAAWVPTTSFECSGGVRFINGSCRGFVLGPSAIVLDGGVYYGPNDITLAAQGCTPGTYIEKARFINSYFIDSKYQILNSGNTFYYAFNGAISSNPLYGYVIPGSAFTGTAGVRDQVIYDAVVDFTITDALTSAPIPFKIYTPYTFALTGVPVWIQTVLPDSNNITSVAINWGDGTTDTYTTSTSTTYYFAHTYSTASSVPYTVIVTGNDGTTNFPVTASQRFYIQNTYSDLNLEDYAATLGLNLILPYSREEVNVGSNEWAVADNINAAYNKLITNFDYLNRITDAIKKSPNLTLVEWLRDLVAYPFWNNSLTGSNTYFTLSGSYAGIIPAENIVDFKSYKNSSAAPDYNNYIAYDNGLVQIRKNNYNNTLVQQLSTVANNSTPINVYSVDSNGTDLYVLGSLNLGGTNSLVSVYRYYIGSTLTPINQVGGSNGTLADKNAFNNNPIPNTVKVYNNQVYVGDIGNRCIKIYNSALTYANTIYSSDLSAYDVQHFDINPSNGNIFILGSIHAPNVPVVTSVTTSATDDDRAQYRVTWNHDGERLNQYPAISSNFNVYGASDNSGAYTLIRSLSSDLTIFPNLPKLTTYVFKSSATYISFKVEAIGIDGVITSGQSSSKIVPNDVKFPSPFKILVYNSNSTLLSTFSILEIPSTASIKKMVIDPAGKFVYFLTTENVYKYTTNGIFVNRLLSPSKSLTSLGITEDIVTGFIDENYYFYVVTSKRIFKFTDVPVTEEIVDTVLLDTYYTPSSAIVINENEYIADWVYNKTLKPLLYNHELLAKSIDSKYVITLDGTNNLSNFTTRPLSAGELINSLSADESNYIYSNEIVSSAVINRTLEKIYDAQEAILNTLKPEVIRTPTSYLTNVIGLVTTTIGNVIYEPEPEVTTTTTTTPAPLPVLFTFASAVYVGNVYSDLYNMGPRYSNDFTASFSLINATTACNLNFTLSSTVIPFNLPVTIFVKKGEEVIYTDITSTSATYSLPLQDYLNVDSSTIAADGSASTFGADFEIDLSVGPVIGNTGVIAILSVNSSEGRLYNAKLKNSLMDTNFPNASITVYDVSGDIPYSGIQNNTLGGYLTYNPYAPHSWSINGVASAVNPTVNIVPSTSSVTISANRNTYTYVSSPYVINGNKKMESELVLALHRSTQAPPAIPTYTVDTRTIGYFEGLDGSKSGGSGIIYGTNTYKAGTFANITGNTIYGWWGQGVGGGGSKTSGASAIVFGISPGVFNGFVAAPVITLIGGEVYGPLSNALTFVDGDKTIVAQFVH